MPLTGKEMLELLKKNGWIERRTEDSHHHLYKDGVRITVPVHGNQDLGKGLEQRILKDALAGADVFIGVSGPNVLRQHWIFNMAKRPIIFAMANPTPEIFPDEAIEVGAYIVGTGRSDFPNQINNVLAFPGIFRGALDAQACRITIEMQLAAAKALANLIPEKELTPTNIIPDVFDSRVTTVVAESVKQVVVDRYYI